MRHALRDPIFSEPLQGTVEVDEAYVGGKNTGKGHGAYLDNKTPVVSLVQRGGQKRHPRIFWNCYHQTARNAEMMAHMRAQMSSA